MDRREFLRRSALVATGAIAADQFDLLERLGGAFSAFRRRFFAGADFGAERTGTIAIADLLNARHMSAADFSLESVHAAIARDLATHNAMVRQIRRDARRAGMHFA